MKFTTKESASNGDRRKYVPNVAFLCIGVALGYFQGYGAGGIKSCAPLLVAPTAAGSSISSSMGDRDDDDVWKVLPMAHTRHQEVFPGLVSDAFNPFHNYFKILWNGNTSPVVFKELPMWHSWVHFMEGYHNHFHRFRGKEKIVFMEIGVQSGGKIAVLRDYFGPGFTYIGIDINVSTKSKFETLPGLDDWVHIEIGDSENKEFLAGIKQKYPHVDIFLDDGGHSMAQQITAIKEMLPHVQPEGVYICEDLSTSWSPSFGGGIANQDARHTETFLKKTMVGFIHQTMDWLQFGWIPGGVMRWQNLPDNFFGEEHKDFWRIIPQQVKHIHYYNQFVVYEKGITYVPKNYKTVGSVIPYKDTGTYKPTDWDSVLRKLNKYTHSPFNKYDEE
jgi:hypothetical protein